MSAILARLRRHLPGWLYLALEYAPVITVRRRILNRIDRVEVAAYQRGDRDARQELAVAELAARIEAGPQPARRCAVRFTPDGTALYAVAG